MIASERETTVVTTDDSDWVDVWTYQRKHLSALRKNPVATEVESGFVDGTEYGHFRIPADRWSPVGGIKRQLSPQEKARRAEALAHARVART